MALFLLLLTSCDPGVDFGYKKDFDGHVDPTCVEQALKSVSPDVKKGTYVSEGDRGFPRGTEVTQFYYPDPVLNYGYTVDIASLRNGRTHYFHAWSKLGTDVPADERAKVFPLLKRANEAVAEKCGLSFAGAGPEVMSG